MSRMRDTPIKTIEALGQAVRARRLEKKLSQAELAQRMGVERKWVVRLEAGNQAAEIGNVLKAMKVLDLELKAIEPGSKPIPVRAPTLTPRVRDVFASEGVMGPKSDARSRESDDDTPDRNR